MPPGRCKPKKIHANVRLDLLTYPASCVAAGGHSSPQQGQFSKGTPGAAGCSHRVWSAVRAVVLVVQQLCTAMQFQRSTDHTIKAVGCHHCQGWHQQHASAVAVAVDWPEAHPRAGVTCRCSSCSGESHPWHNGERVLAGMVPASATCCQKRDFSLPIAWNRSGDPGSVRALHMISNNSPSLSPCG